jgi:DNA-directed RNA polymerase subunit RPC12/RpoP
LRKHKRLKHKLRPSYQCDKCDKKFGDKIKFDCHIEYHHRESLNCKYCGKLQADTSRWSLAFSYLGLFVITFTCSFGEQNSVLVTVGQKKFNNLGRVIGLYKGSPESKERFKITTLGLRRHSEHSCCILASYSCNFSENCSCLLPVVSIQNDSANWNCRRLWSTRCNKFFFNKKGGKTFQIYR